VPSVSVTAVPDTSTFVGVWRKVVGVRPVPGVIATLKAVVAGVESPSSASL